jgi:hypothetical protein
MKSKYKWIVFIGASAFLLDVLMRKQDSLIGKALGWKKPIPKI